MALTIPGLNADVLSKLKSGDLGALEQLFRAAYPALLAKAREVLDDDGAAARVIERLIPGLFAQRATFTTPDAFTGMLEGAVHEAAVRERSRLAGIHKHGDAGRKAAVHPAPSVDDVWKRVTSAIQGPSEEAHKQALEARAKAKHEAATHIKEVTKSRPWYYQVLAVLVLTGVVAGGVVLYQKRGEVARLASEVRGTQVRELKTGTGQRGNVTLDDSSTASLGSDSRIAIPLSFAEKYRGIGLSGAAEFTIKQDPMPFWLIAGNTHIVAVGGESFAVRAFPSDSSVLVRVKSGTVQVNVTEPEKSAHTLAAGQALLVNKDGTTTQPSDTQLAEALGFLDGNFSITEKPLRYALSEIRRWYGIDLVLKDSTMGGRLVTIQAPLTSSTEAIRAVENAANLMFQWEKQTMTLVERPPAPAK